MIGITDDTTQIDIMHMTKEAADEMIAMAESSDIKESAFYLAAEMDDLVKTYATLHNMSAEMWTKYHAMKKPYEKD